jgi:hypothetical protein
MIIVLYKVTVFYADLKSKMATIAGYRLTVDPMGKCSNAFFSETTNMIKAKLYKNVHWKVLYNLKVFCSDMKFKMAATAVAAILNFISEQKPKDCRRPSNEHSCTVWL